MEYLLGFEVFKYIGMYIVHCTNWSIDYQRVKVLDHQSDIRFYIILIFFRTEENLRPEGPKTATDVFGSSSCSIM